MFVRVRGVELGRERSRQRLVTLWGPRADKEEEEEDADAEKDGFEAGDAVPDP